MGLESQVGSDLAKLLGEKRAAAMATVSKKKPKSKKKHKSRNKKKKSQVTAGIDLDLFGDADKAEASFAAWAPILSKRTSPKKAIRVLDQHPIASLSWMIDKDRLAGLATAALLPSQGKKSNDVNVGSPIVESLAIEWMEHLSSRPHDSDLAIDALTLAYCLRRSTKSLSSQVWIGLLEALCAISRTESFDQCDERVEDVWAELLLRCELPLTLAWLFPEVDRCKKAAKSAATLLGRHLEELLDGQGVILGDHLPRLGRLAASWTRCLALLRDIASAKVTKAAQSEYDWMVRHLLRVYRPDGRTGPDPNRKGKSELGSVIRSGLQLTEDVEDQAIAKARLDDLQVPSKRWPKEPSVHSEWSGVAVLQSDWSRDSPRLIVDFSKPTMSVELANYGEVVFSSALRPDFTVDKKAINPDAACDPWESICWYTDEDSDYLELELDLDGGWRLQRQFLLSRSQRFLLLSDNVVCKGVPDKDQHPQANLEYTLRLPITRGLKGKAAVPAREVTLRRKKQHLVKVLPIGLPEWRDDYRFGELEISDDVLLFSQKGQGMALNAALFLDLDESRRKHPCTWRQLTVAETRQIVGKDIAVGYRVQIGPEQWMMYRSLAPAGNRTLIGQNLSSEFLFAGMNTDGEAASIVEIE